MNFLPSLIEIYFNSMKINFVGKMEDVETFLGDKFGGKAKEDHKI